MLRQLAIQHNCEAVVTIRTSPLGTGIHLESDPRGCCTVSLLMFSFGLKQVTILDGPKQPPVDLIEISQWFYITHRAINNHQTPAPTRYLMRSQSQKFTMELRNPHTVRMVTTQASHCFANLCAGGLLSSVLLLVHRPQPRQPSSHPLIYCVGD